MNDKAQFHVEGAVTRKWVASSGKMARLTIRVELEHRSPKIDCVAFDKFVIEAIEKLDERDAVIASGQITMTPVRNKKGEEIQVDGYERWVPQLVIDELNGEFDENKEADAHEEQEPRKYDDIPF